MKKSLLCLFFLAFANIAQAHSPLVADLETEQVNSSGDAADDTSIWINPTHPEKSLIVATDKNWGLITFDLNGKKVSELNAGKVNNIDSRDNFNWNGQSFQIFAGSERSKNSIDFYKIENDSKIVTIGSLALNFQPYGICTGYLPGNPDLQVFIPTKSGLVDQWSVKNNQTGKSLTITHVNSFSVSSTAEGCVIDDKEGMLFLSQESKGLWKFDLTGNSKPVLVDQVGGKGRLVADVEGLSIYDRPGQERLLFVSSQGDNSFHVYNLSDLSHKGSFSLVDGATIDGVNDTDGIEVVSLGIHPLFRDGFFLAQDGSNKSETGKSQKQNFKIVDIQKILKSLR